MVLGIVKTSGGAINSSIVFKDAVKLLFNHEMVAQITKVRVTLDSRYVRRLKAHDVTDLIIYSKNSSCSFFYKKSSNFYASIVSVLPNAGRGNCRLRTGTCHKEPIKFNKFMITCTLISIKYKITPARSRLGGFLVARGHLRQQKKELMES